VGLSPLVDDFVFVDAHHFDGRFLEDLLHVDGVRTDVKVQNGNRLFLGLRYRRKACEREKTEEEDLFHGG
jgi:hypothetical protein